MLLVTRVLTSSSQGIPQGATEKLGKATRFCLETSLLSVSSERDDGGVTNCSFALALLKANQLGCGQLAHDNVDLSKWRQPKMRLASYDVVRLDWDMARDEDDVTPNRRLSSNHVRLADLPVSITASRL